MKKILSRIKFIYIFFEFCITIFFLIVMMYINKSKNRYYRKQWSILQMKSLGIEARVTGKIDDSANLYLINHQSLLDIIVLEAICEKDLCWVAKKEIGQIPIFGHILKAPDMIPIDRESKKSLLQLIADVRDRVSKNRPICLFPEGTRGDGKNLLKFKSGSKLVANKLKLKVQPIVLTNTRDILDSKSLSATSGVVGVHFLDVVDTSSDGWFEDMREKMQKKLQDELANNTSDR
jgi:1-acyl-sn-glycerol-3-phosphate acyltransferase